ncbi:unnamed protein product [Polarella glacialis]|nr:unnamed protein product [Polarella glacialis]
MAMLLGVVYWVVHLILIHEHSDLNGPEYDCDGDGVVDCGKYDRFGQTCANLDHCLWKYHLFSCLPPGKCCKCRATQCLANATAKAPEGEPDQSHVYDFGKWQNWANHIESCAPWTMPSDDKELAALLAYATEHGYKVRPSGATHSAGGLVTSQADTEVLVVSLGKYTAPEDWEYKLTPQEGKIAGRVMVNAGWTQLQLMAKIRPLNYFLPSQTAGYFFQLAGIVANTVHGGIYESGFIYEYVTRMRVMLHDGSIKVIDDEKDLRFWRTSFGLLGLIIGLEFELVQRPKLQVYTVPQRKLADWSEVEFWRYINVDAAANVPPSTPGFTEPTGSQEAASGEFFLNFGLDDLLGSSMLCVATRKNG